MLAILPLYPKVVDEFVYAVNLFAYTKLIPMHCMIYWSIVGVLVFCGITKIVFVKFGKEKYQRGITTISLLVSFFGVLYFALRREAYAITVLFMILVLKGIILIKHQK